MDMEGQTDLVFRSYKNTGAWFVAYLAGFGSGIGDLAVGVNVLKGGHP